MEQLRQSIIKQEEDKMNTKLTLLQQQVGYPLNEYLNDEFMNKISDDSFLWQVLSNKYLVMKGHKPQKQEIKEQKLYEEITFYEFVNECMQAIMFFHLIIMDFKLNLRIVTDSIQTLQQQVQILKDYQQIKFEQPNRLSISYTRHKSLKTDIFRYYKIKYKVAMNQQEQKSIYAYGDDLVCSFPILPESNTLHFTVLGKRIEGGTEFQELSRIDMGLDEVLVSFDLKTYSKEQIKPCMLTLDYKDEAPDAPFDGANPIELRFTLSMPSDLRITLMSEIIERQKKIEQQYHEQIDIKNKSIQHIIQPFNDVVYILGEDLKHRNQTDERELCSVCKIF